MVTTPRTVTIELDKPRTLRLDFNAILAFEDETGLNVLAGNPLADGNFRVSVIRALVWSALRAEDPDVTLEEVGSWLHVDNLAYVGERIGELLQVSMPEAEPGAEGTSAQGEEVPSSREIPT